MKPPLELPTEDRDSYIVRIDYVVSYDGDNIEVEVECEFPTDDDGCYLLSMVEECGYMVFEDEISAEQVADIKAEARAELEAQGVEI